MATVGEGVVDSAEATLPRLRELRELADRGALSKQELDQRVAEEFGWVPGANESSRQRLDRELKNLGAASFDPARPVAKVSLDGAPRQRPAVVSPEWVQRVAEARRASLEASGQSGTSEPGPIERALAPYAATLFETRARPGLPEEVAKAMGRYIAGATDVLNHTLRGRGNAESEGWVLVGKDKAAAADYFQNIYRFTLSTMLTRPKMVFQATAKAFTPGQALDAFLSTSQNPVATVNYLGHPTQKREVVAFVLQGSTLTPAPVGVIQVAGEGKPDGAWDEIVIPPGVYSVAKVEETAFGKVVTLRPRPASAWETPDAFRAKAMGLLPEIHLDFSF